MSNNVIYKTTFQSDLYVVKKVLNDILACLRNQFPKISEDSIFELRIIYSELLFNAVLHGNKDNPSKEITVEVSSEHKKILSIIKDEGNGFDYKNVLSGDSSNLDMNNGGRGLLLVKGLTDFLSFNAIGNEIMFHKEII